MTTHEFNQNILFSKDETYQALVSHFNQIAESGKNKRFEWEDENLTETHNITFDFDEWFSRMKECVREDFLWDAIDIPENLDDKLLVYANQLKDFVDGFVLDSTGLYQGKSFSTNTYRSVTFQDIVERIKQARDNNQMVFLREVVQIPERLEDTVVERYGYTTEYPKSESYYRVRYGVLNG